MCGIYGEISYSQKSLEDLETILETISHRGPDGSGSRKFVLNPEGLNLYLGHVRLSIIDLSEKGAQPMDYLTKYTITYNGEIYNYLELREELVSLGYEFKSDTDTEIIMAAFDMWGTDCLSRLNGMFAFSLFDSSNDMIFIARDRYGIKPLYYHLEGNNFSFSSEIKAILANEDIRDSIEPNELECRNYLRFGPREWKKNTLFQSVYRFPKASFIYQSCFSLIEDGPNFEEYYCLQEEGYSDLKEDSVVKKYYKLLESAVSIRLRADVSIGTALSGGLDSSSIAKLINNQLLLDEKNHIQKTFSCVYPEEGYESFDESSFIDLATNFLHVDSQKIQVHPEDVINEYEKMIWSHDTPPDGAMMSSWHTYKLVSEHGVKISIDGQGADEQLAGYDNYLISYLIHLNWSNFIKEYRSIKAKFSDYKQILNLSFFLKILKSFGLLRLVSYLLKKNGSHFDPSKSLRSMRIQTFQQNLSNLLFYGDRQSMAWSVESRLPFMDYRLVDFLNSTPEEFKIKHGWGKWLARKAFENELPDEIVWRENKMGWEVPEEKWFTGPLLNWSEEQVSNSSFLKHIKNNRKIRLSRGSSLKPKLRELNLAIWHEIFFKRPFADHPKLGRVRNP